MDLLLDRVKNDLVFINGACPTTGDRVDVVIQRLYIRLRTFFGEWFLDITYGVPYLERALGHKVSKTTIDMMLQEQILKENGVKQIISFTSTMDNPTRVYSCSFKVKTDSGEESELITI